MKNTGNNKPIKKKQAVHRKAACSATAPHTSLFVSRVNNQSTNADNIEHRSRHLRYRSAYQPAP